MVQSSAARTESSGNPNAASPLLEIAAITKKFGDFTALDNISFTIDEGEFVCFLGPSGCGKTTLLRCIAGLEMQTSGRIIQRGRDISDLPPGKRDFGIVFQSYALFPNLTVEKNIAYGLTTRRMERERIRARVAELLDMVGLAGSEKKYPAALSGGQQQRVALARALATSPGLLLLDEPLSALDAKVRIHLRHRIKQLQRDLGVTTIMVTHDQEEALSLADRIVVMNHGLIEQIGTPVEIYRQPASPYIADFVGTMNFLTGTLAGKDRLNVGSLTLEIDRKGQDIPAGRTVTACIRPEDIALHPCGSGGANTAAMIIEDIEFLGAYCRARLQAPEAGIGEILADFPVSTQESMALAPGSRIDAVFPKERLLVFEGTAEGISQHG